MQQSMRGNQPQLARRPDIQSLRALAISLVVAAHAHVSGLQGGYVGVDVFFVLSGYLISGLILTEVDSTGRFRAWAFYARRLKRLLPALLLVLLVTAVVAWVFGTAGQPADATAGRAADLWLSNFYFAARQINYFSPGGGPNLFLHTWSLGVEEQFYLLWPWLLLFLYGMWMWQGKPMSRKRLAIGLLIAAGISLVLGVYWARTDMPVGFYLMPGRVWEFALGALVFLARERADEGRLLWLDRLRGRSLFNVSGWLIIVAAGVLYTSALRYPGFWAVVPCMGAALVLFDAPEKCPTGIAARITMCQPAVQFVGDISYSLYLWHWPVLILGREMVGNSPLARAGLVMLSVVLAAATYYALENPVRRIRFSHPFQVLAPSTLGLAVGFFALGTWYTTALAMLHTPRQYHIEVARMDAPIIYVNYGRDSCDTWFHSARVVACEYGPRNAGHTVAMFGDSVLAQWFTAVADIYLKKPGWKIVVLTKSACSAQEVSYYYPRIKAEYTVCDRWRRRALNYLVELHPNIVIMGSTRYGFTAAQWIDGTRAVLARLSPVVGHVVVMSPTPELQFNGPDCLSQQAARPRWWHFSKPCARRIRPASDDRIFALLKAAAKPYHNVAVVDMSNAVCPHDVCHAQIGSTIAYRDGMHLTASFVNSLAPALRIALRKATGVARPRIAKHEVNSIGPVLSRDAPAQ